MITSGCQAYRAWDYSPRLLATGVNQQTVASVEDGNCSERIPCHAPFIEMAQRLTRASVAPYMSFTNQRFKTVYTIKNYLGSPSSNPVMHPARFSTFQALQWISCQILSEYVRKIHVS